MEDQKDLKVYLAGLSVETLSDLSTYIEGLIVTKTPDTVPAFAYDAIVSKFTSRFSFRQVDNFRPWRALQPAKRAQFQKAWIKAIKFYKSLDSRFVANDKLADSLISMVANSPFFTDKLLFTDLLESLNQIEVLFDYNFPNYRTMPMAIDKLVEALT